MLDPIFLRNTYTTCLSLFPDSIGRYIAVHMNTVPKFLNHILLVMGVCNLFLILSSLAISPLTFLAALLLSLQNVTVLLTLQNSPSNNHNYHNRRPSILRPTEFMLGLCLGITIGGTILSFFLCLAFGKVHAFCTHLAELEGPGSCGWRTGSFNGVWWWSSCLFWLELIASFLLAIGHHDLVSESSSHTYQSVDGMDSSSSSPGHQNFYQGSMGSAPPPSFAQQPTSGAPVITGRYSDIPDVATQSDPLQAQVLQV